MDHQLALQQILAARLKGLKTRYPGYSMRAFAKKAGISPATMSLLLQGKRRTSVKILRLLDERLSFDPQEQSEVFPARRPKSARASAPYVQLRLDQYELVSDWRCFAILNLIETANFQSDDNWISERLAISVDEVKETIARLIRLEMLIKKSGRYTRAEAKFRTTEDIKNASLQRSHSQTLDLAQNALEEYGVESRDYSWATFAFDLRRLPAAKALIRKFQDELMDLVEENSTPTEVYRLAVQLFPLTKLKAQKTAPRTRKGNNE